MKVRKIQAIFLFTLFTFVSSFCLSLQSAVGQTAAELQTKIDSQNQAIKDLEREIATYQSQLTTLSAQKDTLGNAIKILTLESKKLSADIKVSEGKISATNLRLETLGASIQKTSLTIGDLKNAIAKSIAEMREMDNQNVDQVLLAGKNISDIWHYAGAQTSFRISLQEKTGQLFDTKQQLVVNQSEVEKAKNELLRLRSNLQDQKKINQKTQAQENALLAATKNQEASYQKLVTQKSAQKAQLENDLRDYESRLKYVLNPSLLPPSGSSPFIWPLDRIVITQLFGKTTAAARLYVSGSHNGVDFGASIGTPVKALASGVVVGSGNTDIACPGASYGNWVFIKYDNGLASVFGHLSLVKAATGARVGTGEVVAYSGATGYATGPHLHVSVFPRDGVSISSFPSKACPGRTITIPTAAINAYLDPMNYFPKR